MPSGIPGARLFSAAVLALSDPSRAIAGVLLLLPAGFFLSVAGRGVTMPNRLFGLVYAGALAFAIGVTLGVGLLLA